MEPCEFVNSVEWREKKRRSHNSDGDKDTETTDGSATSTVEEGDKALERYQV